MKFLITSGGTDVPIDGVRKITNVSTGRFGARIATSALVAGHDVTFLYAKDSVHPFHTKMIASSGQKEFSGQLNILDEQRRLFDIVKSRFHDVPFKDFDDYATKLQQAVKVAEIVILVAAVSDYGPVKEEGKISSDQEELVIRCRKLPKLITQVKTWNPAAYLVGFKLLVDSSPEELRAAAQKQINAAKSDMVVGNDMSEIRRGKHRLTLFQNKGGSAEVFCDISGESDFLASDLVFQIGEWVKRRKV